MPIGHLVDAGIRSDGKWFESPYNLEILGKLVRKNPTYPTLYLLKKTINNTNAWAALNETVKDVQNGNDRYISYDGHPLSYHALHEKEYMWIIDDHIQVHYANTDSKHVLERWDN